MRRSGGRGDVRRALLLTLCVGTTGSCRAATYKGEAWYQCCRNETLHFLAETTKPHLARQYATDARHAGTTGIPAHQNVLAEQFRFPMHLEGASCGVLSISLSLCAWDPAGLDARKAWAGATVSVLQTLSVELGYRLEIITKDDCVTDPGWNGFSCTLKSSGASPCLDLKFHEGSGVHCASRGSAAAGLA